MIASLHIAYKANGRRATKLSATLSINFVAQQSCLDNCDICHRQSPNNVAFSSVTDNDISNSSNTSNKALLSHSSAL